MFRDPPRDYQVTGANFLAARLAAILGDDAGLGKTRETIMAMDRLNTRTNLIVCPAVARLVWPAELQRWSDNPGHIIVLDPREKVPPLPKPDTLTRVTVIVAFDTISARRHRVVLNTLLSWRWDVLVIDEGQRLANPGSNRTQNIYGPKLDGQGGLIDCARRVWVLSGTLTPNHGGEAYAHARALFPTAVATTDGKRLLEYHEFVERYCTYKDTPYGRVITGTRNITELRHRFAPYILRRRKQEVLPELPPLNFVTVPVPGLQIPGELAHLIPDGLDDDDDLLDFLRGHAEHLATLRRHLGAAKLAACITTIIDLLEGGVRKIVVFAHHVALVTELREQLLAYNPVRIAGDTNGRERQRAIDLFQNDPDTRVLVGQINACGVAITLTAASDVVFVEYSWVPGDNYQAASRCHRLGQRDGVLARMLYVPDSLDEKILGAVARKTREVAALWD